MAATKTLAFVLGRQDYRDTSLLVDLCTRDFGKVKGIVRGIRDGRERYGSTLEPFSLNEILFYKRKRGGDLHQVTQVELVDHFPVIREDLERLSYGSYFVELLDELVEVEQPEPEIFDLLHESLMFLASGASPKRVARIYEIKLLELLGLMPEIHHCVICRIELPDPAYFSAKLGGIYCKDCAVKSRSGVLQSVNTQQSGAVGLLMSRGTIHFLEHARRATVKDMYSVKVSQEVGEQLEKALRRFADFHLTRKLKSVVFLEKMQF